MLGTSPILNIQSWNDDEVTNVSGNHRGAMFESDCCNTKVVGTDIELGFQEIVKSGNRSLAVAKNANSRQNGWVPFLQ